MTRGDLKSGETGDALARSSGTLPFIVGATFFMEYLDTTIIATALPQMARSFGVEPNAVSVGMSAYMLTLAVVIPVSGWIAGRLGTRTVFASAIAVFTIASLTCGLSTNLLSFTISRILQGIGGAMMVPVGRMIVVRNTSSSQMMNAISTITWPGIIAPVLGPAAGGFITTYLSWHWIFLLNLPFGLAALWATYRFVPNQLEASKRPLDITGFVLSGAALTAILYGTELASHQDASIPRALGLIVLGLVLGAAAVFQAKRVPYPLIDLSAFKVPTFSTSIIWGSLTRTGVETAPYLLPLLFQIGFGFSAFHSGLLLLASAAGNLGMKFYTTPVFRRFGFRMTAIVNVVANAALILACGWLSPSSSVAVIAGLLVVYGMGRSLQFQSLGTLVYAGVPDDQKGAASVMNSVVQQMTIGMGIAFGALSLRLAALLHGPQAGREPIVLGDFRYAFGLAALIILISIVGYIRLPLDAGEDIGGGTGRRGAS